MDSSYNRFCFRISVPAYFCEGNRSPNPQKLARTRLILRDAVPEAQLVGLTFEPAIRPQPSGLRVEVCLPHSPTPLRREWYERQVRKAMREAVPFTRRKKT